MASRGTQDPHRLLPGGRSQHRRPVAAGHQHRRAGEHPDLGHRPPRGKDRDVPHSRGARLWNGIRVLDHGTRPPRRSCLGQDDGDAVLCIVGAESWRAKEAEAQDGEAPAWAGQRARPPGETVTAVSLLQAGADILLLRRPKAAEVVRSTLAQLLAERTRNDSDR